MFIQPCFIRKNTKELRNKIYNLKNRKGTFIWQRESDTLLAVDKDSYRCYDNSEDTINKLINNGFIDCGIDEELFLALAALRDDSDKNQFFVLETRLGSINYPDSIVPEGALMLCFEDRWFRDLDENSNPNPLSSFNIPSHKATVEELINFFKNR